MDEEFEAESAGLSEAERAMQAAKRRQDEEDAAKLAEYEEQRRIQREKDEEEIRMLKEKQERRKKEREEEDRLLAERLKENEEKLRIEEEARKAKHDEEKRKKEEEKKKRQAQMTNQFKTDGPNFQIPAEGERKQDDKMSQFDKFGNIVKAKQEMGLTKEQQEELKKRVMADILKPLSLDGLDVDGLRHKIKELHSRLSRLESDRYDLEKRAERQTYDLKELNERQRQINRNKALKKGLDPDVIGSARHPPKIVVSSKYDRQTDRRSFTDRKGIFDKPKTFPHFPNVPPPPTELIKVVAGEGHGGSGGGHGGHGGDQDNEEQEEEEEEGEEEEEEEEEE